MFFENGELEVVFCIDLPPETLHRWLVENAPGFAGWRPANIGTDGLILDVYEDADQVGRDWAFAYQYVDLIARTEVHAHCRYFFLTQPFELFMVRVAKRFPEARKDLLEALQDPNLVTKMPNLLETLRSMAAEPISFEVPTTVINIGSIDGLFNNSFRVVAVDVPTTEAERGTSLELDSSLETSEKDSTEEATVDRQVEQDAHSESSGQDSPLKRIHDLSDRAIVMKLIQGQTDPEIGRRLGVSPKTVSNRLSKLRKLYPGIVPTRSELHEDPDLAAKLLAGVGPREGSGRNREVSRRTRESI